LTDMTEAGRPVYHNPGKFFDIPDQILKRSLGRRVSNFLNLGFSMRILVQKRIQKQTLISHFPTMLLNKKNKMENGSFLQRIKLDHQSVAMFSSIPVPKHQIKLKPTRSAFGSSIMDQRKTENFEQSIAFTAQNYLVLKATGPLGLLSAKGQNLNYHF